MGRVRIIAHTGLLESKIDRQLEVTTGCDDYHCVS